MNDRLGWLDVLRGVAVLGVLVVHTAQAFPFSSQILNEIAYLGRFGVQLFFVISGYIIFSLFEQRKYRGYAHFIVRRTLRLVPLFWLFMLVNLFISGFGKTYWAPFGIDASVVLSSLLLLHSLLPSSISAIVPGGWSISVEFLCYLTAPFLANLILKKPAIVLSVFFLLHVLYVILKPTLHTLLFPLYADFSATIVEDFLYLNWLNNVHFFVLGMGLASSIKKLHLFSVLAVYTVGVLINFFLDLVSIKEVLFAIGPSLLTVLILLSRRCLGEANTAIYRLLRVIGRYSYGIYLIHTLVLLLLVEIYPGFNTLIVLFVVLVTSSLLARVLEGYDSRTRNWVLSRLEDRT